VSLLTPESQRRWSLLGNGSINTFNGNEHTDELPDELLLYSRIF
jgi:hypothetical protein